jgi:hypothetical protein
MGRPNCHPSFSRLSPKSPVILYAKNIMMDALKLCVDKASEGMEAVQCGS